MIILNNFSELQKLIKDTNELILDLANLSNQDFIKTISFLIGLTYKNGNLIKLQSKVFKVIF